MLIIPGLSAQELRGGENIGRKIMSLKLVWTEERQQSGMEIGVEVGYLWFHWYNPLILLQVKTTVFLCLWASFR